jgi:hypothetical protein
VAGETKNMIKNSIDMIEIWNQKKI